MANEVLVAAKEKQERELTAYLESIEQAKWNMYTEAKFVYNINIEFHDFVYEADKFFKTLGE